ncbi:Glycosyl hydrolases family 43 [compost metagenome]
MLETSDIQIRDPYILTLKNEACYYMYGTTDSQPWGGKATGFDAYRSKDLKTWEGPFEVFRPTADFWADENFWAPEVHRYNGKYYMLASFKAEDHCRGTQILEADTPEGPFIPLTSSPITPLDWECLDGTLYIDPQNKPWIVYCREWLEVYDGEIYAQQLSENLSDTVGEPLLLLRASEAPWVVLNEENGRSGYVTDAPFLISSPDGQLYMIWSSQGKEGYAIGLARSLSGTVSGPWIHEKQPLFSKDGGHGMIFEALDGLQMVSLHRPNLTPLERAIFVPLCWDQDKPYLQSL